MSKKNVKFNESINKLCIDCINECKQSNKINIITCPKKIKADEQMLLFNKNGKPKKWR